MLSNPIHARVLPALFATLGFGATALAGQVSFQGNVPLTTTNWQQSVSLTKFDPALGDLLGVVVSLEAHNEGTAAFENQDAASATVTMTFSTRIEVLRPDNSLILFAQPSVNTSDDATAFDGVLDFAGPSGRAYNNLSQTVNQAYNAVPPSPDLALFTGPAGNPGTITLPVTAVGLSTGTGAGNLTLAFTSQASAVVTVQYLYAPDCNNNDVPDDQDIQTGTSADCDSNEVPDECQPDCNLDGTIDACEADCDHDGTPDECDKTPCPECREINRQTPGSLLLFPEFDNRRGQVTLFTVTNTNCDSVEGSVWVEFVYIGRFGPNGQELNCTDFNRTRQLTPCDTITLWTTADNPNQRQGYMYAFAKDAQTGAAISFNHLIGESFFLSPTDALDDGLSALVFKAFGADGTPTDTDDDGIRDLDGREYDEAPAELLIPRFLGQDDVFDSRLILIGLSGGTAFTTTVSFLIYNDNEEPTSAEYQFFCWEDPRLVDINQAFAQDYLVSTTHDVDEIAGASYHESGWIRVNGKVAQSSQAEIADPAVYAVLVERAGSYSVADLPWELCTQANGDLLPVGLFGDTDDN